MTECERLIEVMSTAYLLASAEGGWSSEYMAAALEAADAAGYAPVPKEATREIMAAGSGVLAAYPDPVTLGAAGACYDAQITKGAVKKE